MEQNFVGILSSHHVGLSALCSQTTELQQNGMWHSFVLLCPRIFNMKLP